MKENITNNKNAFLVLSTEIKNDNDTSAPMTDANLMEFHF